MCDVFCRLRRCQRNKVTRVTGCGGLPRTFCLISLTKSCIITNRKGLRVVNIHQYLYANILEQYESEASNLKRVQVYPHRGTGLLSFSNLQDDYCWARLEVESSIMDYYTWFLTCKGIRIEKPKHGSHVSVLRGEVNYAQALELSSVRSGNEFDFSYGDLVTNGRHWWLELQSPCIEQYRVSLGLSPRPKAGLHLTLGRTIRTYRP